MIVMKRWQLVLSFILLCYPSLCRTNWDVFVYMDSSDDLNDMAIKNITDAMRAQINDANDTVDFNIQLHAYDTVGLRYKITTEGLSFVGDVALTGNAREDFINAAQWGFAHHNPAHHTMLIFWNHGWGILDPQWNAITNEWEAGIDSLSNFCPIKRSRKETCRIHQQHHRGFIFSTTPRSYLNNQDLQVGLCFIQENMLQGKKLDILAFDTCMGGMFEVLYQVAPFAHYLVGNQVCSLRDGCDYYAIAHALNQSPTPNNMVKIWVEAFDAYYRKHDTDGIYVHTGLNSSHAQNVSQALDNVITLLLQREDCATIALQAHIKAPRFCMFSMYTDLVAYITEIEKLLPDDTSSAELKHALSRFYDAIQQCVVAHCAGFQNNDKVHGCAIYLPTYTIDDSYKKTSFAKQSQWSKLLELIETTAQKKQT